MVNSRFSVAIHILSLIATTSDKSQLTSDYIAGSVNTNPVVVRRMIGKLKKAGLLTSQSGIAGLCFVIEPKDLSLLSIYRAIDGPEQLFAIHDEPNPACAVTETNTAYVGNGLSRCLACNGKTVTSTNITRCARSTSLKVTRSVLLYSTCN